jgi:hypothetical protein
MNTAIATAPAAATKKSVLTLLTVDKVRLSENHCHIANDLECSICYKQITNAFFVCSAPCNKLFHKSCLEQSMEQTAETAFDADEDVVHRCCYCRRNINMKSYYRQLFARHLKTVSFRGLDVSYALAQLAIENDNDNNDEDDDEEEEEIEYLVYDTIDIRFMKKPKQSKRTEFKKNVQSRRRNKMMPHAAIKQNIGGRRR